MSPQPPQPPRRSKYGDYFEITDTSARCLIDGCGHVAKRTHRSTGTIFYHVRRCHPTVFARLQNEQFESKHDAKGAKRRRATSNGRDVELTLMLDDEDEGPPTQVAQLANAAAGNQQQQQQAGGATQIDVDKALADFLKLAAQSGELGPLLDGSGLTAVQMMEDAASGTVIRRIYMREKQKSQPAATTESGDTASRSQPPPRSQQQQQQPPKSNGVARKNSHKRKGAASASVTEGKTAEKSSSSAAAATAVKEEPAENYEDELFVSLMRHFYDVGWMRGTGGALGCKQADRWMLSPSALQKERLQSRDIFIYDLAVGALVQRPPLPAIKETSCSLLFAAIIEKTDARCVIHTHSKAANLISQLTPGHSFEISHQEYIKGIRNCSTGAYHSYGDTLRVPVIENKPKEQDLLGDFERALEAHPEASAFLVRRHGLFVWGPTWQSAKIQAECLDYLFDLAVDMHRLGLPLVKRAPPGGAATTAPTPK